MPPALLLTKRLVNMKTSINKIRNAAIAEFAHYGYDGSRVDRIAKKAKINKAMIYYHFSGKEALYTAILESLAHTIVDTVHKNINEAMETGNPLIIIEAYAAHISSLDKRYFMIMMRELASGGTFIKKIIAPAVIEPMTKIIGTVFASAKDKNMIRDVHPQFTMISAAGAVIFYNLMRQILQGTTLHAQYFSDEHVQDYINNVLKLLRRGITKEGK